MERTGKREKNMIYQTRKIRRGKVRFMINFVICDDDKKGSSESSGE